ISRHFDKVNIPVFWDFLIFSNRQTPYGAYHVGRRLFALSIHPVRTASVTAKENASTSLDKAFEILDLFSLARPILRIEEISALLGYTRSTAYRYLKALCDAGLLAPSSGGTYALGPRIIELEHLLQLTDPLYLAGRKVLRTLHAE